MTIIAPGGQSGEGFFSIGRSFVIRSNRSNAHLAFGPRVANRLRRLFYDIHFDILHLHEPFIPSVSLLALLYSRTANLATFHAAREGGSVGYRLAWPFLYPLATKLNLRAAVSPAALELVSRYFPGEYHILPNGVDTEIFTPEGVALEGLNPNNRYLIFVGRDEPRKGLDILLKAFKQVHEKHNEFRLLVVGAEKKKNNQTSKGVAWLGKLPDEFIPASYRSACMMVSPALGWESFGIVLIEAMACGLPVVASDIPGYRSVIEDGVQGILTPPGNSKALAEAMLSLMEDEPLRKSMSTAALERSAEYSWDRLVGEVEEDYQEAMERYKKAT